MSNKQGKLIVVVGETASGKSSLAIKIAKLYGGEVLSADSRAVYKGMNVGTAKPDEQEMDGVKHHGLDLVEPNEKFSAAMFKDYATEVIEQIWQRGNLAVMVGGTGLYVDGVLYDYSFGGDASSVPRSELNNKSVVELTEIAHKMGIEIDSETAKNRRHLGRLIERAGRTEKKTEIVYNALLLGYKTSHTQLRKRVEQRVEVMFRKGLRKEYNDLRAKYGSEFESFTGIGYREFAAWEAGKASISEVKRTIVKNTMGLAKHQRTWFKRNININWVDTEEEALALVSIFLDNK